MKFQGITLPAIGIILGGAALLAGGEADIGELTRELKGEKPPAERTPEALEAAYAQVLGALLPDLADQDPGKRERAQATLERIAFHASRPGAAERVACSKALAAGLVPANAMAKVWLLRQLERIGRGEAVPAAARLLADPDADVRESARRTLQKNPAVEAGAALRQALGSAEAPAWRAALINALGARRDPSNLDLLVAESRAENDGVRSAALVGLADLGDGSAVPPMAAALEKGSPGARMIAADSFLRLADALAAKGEKAAALEIYKRFLPAEGHRKCAALIGIGRAGTPGDMMVLVAALSDGDASVRDCAVEALSVLAGGDVTPALAAGVPAAKPEAKRGLLQALARRRDRSTLPVFLAAAEDADESVRAAALAGLGAVGDPSAVPVLLKAAATGGLQQETARRSLQALPGKDVDEAGLRSLGERDPGIRVEGIRALAARHAVGATGPLLQAAGDSDASVRNTALDALGMLGPAGALPAVAAVLVKTGDDSSRGRAAGALVRIAERDPDLESRSRPILEALASSGGPARLALLGVLGRIGGEKSLAAVRAALKEGDEKVKDAAIRALAEWPDVTAAEDLLAVARSASGEEHQRIALRGYIRVCRIESYRAHADSAKMLAAGLAAAKRPEEKREALHGLAEVRDPLAVEAIVACLEDNLVKDDAASAAVRLGRLIVDEHPGAVAAAMRKAIEAAGDDRRKREAKEILDRAERKLEESKGKK